jgi:hypothetical protein
LIRLFITQILKINRLIAMGCLRVVAANFILKKSMRPASAKLPNPKPNARWRDGFSLVPSIPVGCADNAGWALWPELCMMSGRSFAQARNQIAKMPENRHFQQKNNCA